MKLLCCIFLSVFVLDVFAATCPTGYLSFDYGTDVVISAQCPSDTTQISVVPSACDSDKCFADYVCNSGVSKLKTITGVSVPLYGQDLTNPAIHTSINSKKCYVPLVSGRLGDAINLRHDGKLYHATSLKVCRVDFDDSIVPVATYSNATYRVDWSLTVDGRAMSGISYCGNKRPDSGNVVDAVPNSSTDLAANDYCYCRIITPLLSDWWYAARYTANGATACDKYCYAQCVESMKTSQTMRSGMYNSMK